MSVSIIPAQAIPSALIFDLETVAEVQTYEELSKRKKELWDNTRKQIIAKGIPDGNFSESLWELAGLYPEFGKIASASFGMFKVSKNNPETGTFFQKNFASYDEKEILLQIEDFLQGFTQKGTLITLGGYHIEKFDIPFLTKRFMIVLGRVPEQLDNYGKKPWELNILDIAKIWQAGSYSMIKLDLLAEVLGVGSSKEEMYGGDVYNTYYIEKDVEKISRYCSMDVVVTANCLMKLAGLPLITSAQLRLIP